MNKKKDRTTKKSMDKSKKSDNKALKILLILAIILIIICLIAIFISISNKKNKDKGPNIDPDAVVGQLDGKTPQEIQMELDRVVKETSMVISINSKIKMKNGYSPAPVKIENVPNNHYIMQVTIILPKNNKVIYKSGFIYPNYHIDEVKFGYALQKGKHDAIAIFYAYDLNTQNLIGEQRANLTIEVEK